jgi:hypothetical protein
MSMTTTSAQVGAPTREQSGDGQALALRVIVAERPARYVERSFPGGQLLQVQRITLQVLGGSHCPVVND